MPNIKAGGGELIDQSMIQAKGLEKKYGQGELQVVALKSLNIEIKDREFVAVVGPSGAGKSTLLYQLSLLDRPTAGEVIVNGHNTSELNEAEKTQIRLRDFGYVFQDYALLPELSTIDNVALPMIMQGMGLGSARRQALQSLARVGLEGKKNNRPSQLSGGQQQRVALSRSLVVEPGVLLLDEPLSNLDAKLRVQMRTELKKLHEKIQATMIYVTHDQIEAMTMGDRIAVIRDGLLQQVDEPLNIYHFPKNKFIAGFIGTPPMNFFKARLFKKDDGLWIDEGTFQLKLLPHHQEKLASYGLPEISVGIRPEDLYDKLYAVMPTPENTFKAFVDIVEPMGSEIYLHLNSGKNIFVVRVDPKSKIRSGEEIEAVVDQSKLHLFHIESEESLL